MLAVPDPLSSSAAPIKRRQSIRKPKSGRPAAQLDSNDVGSGSKVDKRHELDPVDLPEALPAHTNVFGAQIALLDLFVEAGNDDNDIIPDNDSIFNQVVTWQEHIITDDDN